MLVYKSDVMSMEAVSETREKAYGTGSSAYTNRQCSLPMQRVYIVQ